MVRNSGNTSRVATRSGKVRKSGKTKKNDESQEKMGLFEKKSGKVRKFDEIKKKVQICQLKFTNFLIFQSLQMVKN